MEGAAWLWEDGGGQQEQGQEEQEGRLGHLAGCTLVQWQEEQEEEEQWQRQEDEGEEEQQEGFWLSGRACRSLVVLGL